MSRELKFRFYDEKYNTWVNDPLFIYPSTDVVKQGIVIQQYIGLKDKNGKEIYEGDFINFSCDYTMDLSDRDVIEYKNQKVYYDERLAGFYFGKDGFQILDKIMEESIEVVGNIFDNLESFNEAVEDIKNNKTVSLDKALTEPYT
jgi:uncharacterized phage protein (TIGR01671 family)